MPVFLSAFARLQSWLSPASDQTLSVKAPARILRVAGPIIEKLIADDKIGESYRCSTIVRFRYNVPPLAYYHGTTSTCVISGPLLNHGKAYRPTGAIIETPGFDVRLLPEDAYDLDQQIQQAIENTIVDWVAEYQEREAAPESRHPPAPAVNPDAILDDTAPVLHSDSSETRSASVKIQKRRRSTSSSKGGQHV
ncbi:hypothetical protein [Acetobacter thailandicus]|uniref:hypothetical protein n=1 Tax=Acetobacter thailandicus TaxID=1502842 RepID=UPI001BAC13B7|nr:hypothetical protein [Acetobacter thailandicus]MBS0984890.1 hypothetical protein [Acetobacter thailandicus]